MIGMKVYYFTGYAPSRMHIHAWSGGNMFYIPDEKAVLTIEQHGSFGSKTFSVVDNKRILKIAKALSEGKDPDIEGVKYSDAKEFEYDSEKLHELVENARNGRALEEKVKTGIEDLLKQAKEEKEEPAMVDPASLSTKERKRLEGIVTQYVTYDDCRARLLGDLGSAAAARQTETEALKKHLMQSLHDHKKGNMEFSDSILISYTEQAKKAGLEDIAKKFAEIALHPNGVRDIHDRIYAAEVLGRPEKEIIGMKEQSLAEALTGRYHNIDRKDFTKMIEMHRKGIPEENFGAAIRRAYSDLLGQGRNEMMGEGALHAAWLADYLGERGFVELAVEQMIITAEKGVSMPPDSGHETSSVLPANAFDLYGRHIMALDAQNKRVRPFMLEIFGVSLASRTEDAKEIQQKYKFTDDEIRGPVNKEHARALAAGYFDRALELRRLYGNLIANKSVPDEDLQLLIGIQAYSNSQAQGVREEE